MGGARECGAPHLPIVRSPCQFGYWHLQPVDKRFCTTWDGHKVSKSGEVGDMAAEQMAEGWERTGQEPPPRPLDAIDRDILRILQTDGRASIRSVAERVHVSRANAYARINRLIEDRVIRGFGARINHERAGQGASAYITLKIVQNSWRTVREQLQELPGATHIALVSGDFDVLLLVHAPDNRTLRELVLTRLQSIPEVLSTRTLLVFEETDLDPQAPPAP